MSDTPRRRSGDKPVDGPYTPVDVDAEAAVVAAVMQDPTVYDTASERLSAEDFGSPACAAVWAAIAGCDAAGEPVDHITVTARLRASGTLTRAGGVDAIRRLAARDVALENVAAYVDIVAAKSLLRRLVTAGRVITEDAMRPDAEAATVLGDAEKTVFDLGRTRTASSLVEMPAAVAELEHAITRGRSRELLGVPTGFTKLDTLTGGLQPGQLVLIAARPGIGKTALALQIAVTIARHTGAAVPFLSYEMGVEELMLRVLAAELNFDATRLRQGNIPHQLEDDLADTLARLREMTLLIDDNPPDGVAGVRSAMRRLARRRPVAAVFIDYLQLMQGERRTDSRANEIGEISRGLKRLATELEVPVVALAQLNRGLELRPNKRPQLSDLRDSGTLEQDANLVLFLHREAAYNPGAAPENLVECVIGKQRSGPLGAVPLLFDGPTTRFTQSNHTPAPF